MKIIILGSGIIGVTSAWYLSEQGHEVTVIDRRSEAAKETSYSNAGEISPGFATPWAEPGVPLRSLKWLLQKHGAFHITTLDTPLIKWLLKMLRECSAQRFHINASRTMMLAAYSHQHLKILRAQTNIDYEKRERGLMSLHRTQQSSASARSETAFLDEFHVNYQLLNRDECIAHEPALKDNAHKISGALFLPDDETGDCFSFCQQLAQQCQEKGVRFLFNTDVQYLIRQNNRIESVVCKNGELKADAFVVAMGSYSPALLKPLGIDLPIYPVKGYAMTLSIINEAKAPLGGIMDEAHKIGITRFNERVRIGGMAELGGFNLILNPKRKQTLEFVLNDLFPGACDLQNSEFWCGLRPMTPDGTPIIGATPFENLFTNCGHGTLGWTMACGSAKLLVDIIGGKPTDIESGDLNLFRYD